MYQRNQFARHQFSQGTPTFHPGATYPNPVQEYSLISTPILVIDPTDGSVVYSDTEVGSVLRFALMQDDYLPMVEVYTTSKVATIKELASSREKFLATYQPNQANILRRVVEGQVGLDEVEKHKIHDYEGAIKTLAKLNARISEAVNNIELVGVAKSIGYEGTEKVLQVSVQFKNKIDGVVTTVRTIKGPHTVPAFAVDYPTSVGYGLNGPAGPYAVVREANCFQGSVQTDPFAHYVDALQMTYAARPAVMKDLDLKSWVICNVFGISIKVDTPANKREEFILGVRSMLEDVLSNHLANKLEAGCTYPGNVVVELFQASHIFRFDPSTLSRNIPEVDHIAQRFQQDPNHCHWLKETINFDPRVPNATATLLRAVIQLLK